jgi:hypothetical protein
MKNILLCLVLLVISINGFSQDISSDKKYNFEELFEQVKNNNPVFTVTFSKENRILLFYRSQIIFPLVEEKEMMNFSKGNRQREFKPTISFGTSHQSKLNFTIHSSYARQSQSNQLKILKGYDYCLRPIY